MAEQRIERIWVLISLLGQQPNPGTDMFFPTSYPVSIRDWVSGILFLAAQSQGSTDCQMSTHYPFPPSLLIELCRTAGHIAAQNKDYIFCS